MFGEFSLLAYIGPETILPATSVLAALGGMLLVAGRYVRSACVWCCRTVFARTVKPLRK